MSTSSTTPSSLTEFGLDAEVANNSSWSSRHQPGLSSLALRARGPHNTCSRLPEVNAVNDTSATPAAEISGEWQGRVGLLDRPPVSSFIVTMALLSCGWLGR